MELSELSKRSWGDRLSSLFNGDERRALLICGESGQVLSYQTFGGWINRFTNLIGERGVGKGDRIGVCVEDRFLHAAISIGCLGIGVTLVPIDPSTPRVQFLDLLARAKVDLLLGEGTGWGLVESLEADLSSARILKVERQVLDAEGKEGDLNGRGFEPFVDLDFTAIASIHFTSGTTGQPKGVVHTVSNVLESAYAFSHAHGFSQQTRMLHLLPMSYMAGYLNTLLCPLIVGGGVVISRAWDPMFAMDFWQIPRAYDVNTMWLVPTMISALNRLDRDEEAWAWVKESLLHVCVGTAPLPPNERDAFESRYGVNLYESYGLSETLFLSTEVPGNLGGVGGALPGVHLWQGESGGVLAEKDSSIYVETPWNMVGYINEDGCPDEQTSPERFPSGDSGFMDGRVVRITGRDKDLIIRGGTNISPVAVENALLAHPDVDEVAVVGVPHSLLGEEVVAVVVVRDSSCNQESLAAWAKVSLSPAQVPGTWFFYNDLPRTASGKIQRAQLRDELIES